MKHITDIRILIATHAILLGLVISVSAWYVSEKKVDLIFAIDLKYNEQISVVETLAKKTDNNEADAVIEGIVVDCSDREYFEGLLVRLNQLSHIELLQAQKAFDRCGGFFAQRKTFMTSRLAREYEVLRDYGEVRLTFIEDKQQQEILKDWGTVVELEERRSSLFNEQVSIQGDIIKTLIQGSSDQFLSITESMNRVHSITERLQVINKQIDNLRETLIR